MYARFVLSGLIAAAVGAAAYAQDITISEPEYVGDIVAIQANAAVPLEKQRASNRARAGALRARASNQVESASSPVRLSGKPMQFIVRHETNSVNPEQVINIFQLAVNERRDVRQVETGSTGAFT